MRLLRKYSKHESYNQNLNLTIYESQLGCFTMF